MPAVDIAFFSGSFGQKEGQISLNIVYENNCFQKLCAGDA
jgi:hypothetical protein